MKSYHVLIPMITLVVPVITYASNPILKFDVIEDNCSNVMENYNSLDCDQSCQEDIRLSYSHCFATTSETASTDSIRITSFTHIRAISDAISNRFSRFNKPLKKQNKNIAGMSSGNENTNWNAWGSFTRNATDQTFDTINLTDQRGFDTTAIIAVTGSDYSLASNMVLGMSASLSKGDGTIDYLNGSGILVSEESGNDNIAIAPYFATQLSPELSLDVTLGLGRGNLKMFKNTESEYDSWFGGINLSYTEWMDAIQFNSKFNYMHGEESYTDSETNGVTNVNTAVKNELDQIRLGTQVGYWLDGLIPYLGLAYSSDISRKSSQSSTLGNPIGKNVWIWSVGIDFLLLSNDITGGISYTKEEGRDYQENNAIAGNINIRF